MTAAGVPWWHPANLIGSWFGTGYLPITHAANEDDASGEIETIKSRVMP